MWRFALLYLVLVLLAMIEPPAGWQPWFALSVGVVAGAGAFVWLRWENRYQLRRLANGDYDRYDLL
jgi:Flp pilus assembly protein TadB